MSSNSEINKYLKCYPQNYKKLLTDSSASNP